MKKSLISSHFAHHRPRDKLVTYYCYCYQRKPFEKAHREQQKNDRLQAQKRTEPGR